VNTGMKWQDITGLNHLHQSQDQKTNRRNNNQNFYDMTRSKTRRIGWTAAHWVLGSKYSIALYLAH